MDADGRVVCALCHLFLFLLSVRHQSAPTDCSLLQHPTKKSIKRFKLQTSKLRICKGGNKRVEGKARHRMGKLFKAWIIQLACIVWKNDAFVHGPYLYHSFGKLHIHLPVLIVREHSVTNVRARTIFFRNKCTIQSSAQDDFEIPTLEDEVKCGGRDVTTHIKHLHRSVLDLTGRGLYERMKVTIPQDSSDRDIHQSICRNERYVLISHGKQDDPVYNFGNL
jgi:hypothetical protein